LLPAASPAKKWATVAGSWVRPSTSTYWLAKQRRKLVAAVIESPTLAKTCGSPDPRAVMARMLSAIASVIGDPMVYVSGGAEHQGPSGGGPVAVIARRPS